MTKIFLKQPSDWTLSEKFLLYFRYPEAYRFWRLLVIGITSKSYYLKAHNYYFRACVFQDRSDLLGVLIAEISIEMSSDIRHTQILYFSSDEQASDKMLSDLEIWSIARKCSFIQTLSSENSKENRFFVGKGFEERGLAAFSELDSD